MRVFRNHALPAWAPDSVALTDIHLKYSRRYYYNILHQTSGLRTLFCTRDLDSELNSAPEILAQNFAMHRTYLCRVKSLGLKW